MRLSQAALLVPWLAVHIHSALGLVYRDQVGHIDFHHALLGLPQGHGATFFYRPRPDDKATLLYTLSDACVLGAVHPGSGSLRWRQLMVDDEALSDTTLPPPSCASGTAHHVQSVDGEGWLAAGVGHSVHAWNAVSGRSIWWADFAGDVAGIAVAPPLADGDDRHDVLALFTESGETVLRRLHGHDGHVVWEMRETAAAAVRGLHVVTDADKAYVVSVHGTAQLKVLTLDLRTGHRVDEHSLAADVQDVARDLVLVSAGFVAWTDAARTKLKVHVLAAKSRKHAEFALPANTAEVLVHALAQNLVVHTRTADGASHQAQILGVDPASHTVLRTYDLPPAPGAGSFAMTAAETPASKAVFVTRITADEVLLLSAASGSVLARWPLQPGVAAVSSATAEVVAKPGDDGYAVRVAVVTADDDWELVVNGQRVWTRPEGLTGAVAAAFAEKTESENLVKALEQESHSNPLAAYVHRLRRHLNDLQDLPAYLQAIPRRLIRSVLGETDNDDDDEAHVTSDAFGFHKMALLATRRGRLYGLDAASPGKVRWTTKVPIDLAPGAAWMVQRIHVNETEDVAIVLGPTPGQSVAVQIATGALVPFPAGASNLASLDPDTALASTAVVTSAAGPWILALPAGGMVPAASIPVDRCPRESLVVQRSDGTGLQGIRFVVSVTAGCIQQTTWTFALPAGSRVAAVAMRPAHDPVASLGRVLGDRRVLYKYLNPNLVVVAGVEDLKNASSSRMTTFLLDTVSGEVLATADYSGVDTAKPVECVLFENTFVCTFFAAYTVAGATAEAPRQAIQGHHLALSELYASAAPNSRGISSDNVSAVAPLEQVAADGSYGSSLATLRAPAVFAQTYVVPTRLAALAVTQTRQGISVRQVLAYLPGQHGIVGLPRTGQVLDARRPVGRDPTALEAGEEGLLRYAPQLELDPRLVVSHERDVVGIRALAASPTHVESTSLVLAYGAVDVFGTRVAPSLEFDLLDRGFNKVSMLATVAALAVGVAVLRPVVARKQINLMWTAPQ